MTSFFHCEPSHHANSADRDGHYATAKQVWKQQGHIVKAPCVLA